MCSFKCLLLSSHLLLLLHLIKGLDPDLCVREIEGCTGNSCHESMQCFHGDCDASGRCSCELCWQGDNCDKYVDRYHPTFSDAQDQVMVNDPWNSEPIYMAKAYDGDLGSTCPLDAVACDCAEIRYVLIGGTHEGLFAVNNITGEVFIIDPSHITSGITYTLLIAAQGGEWDENYSPSTTMELKVIIDDLHSHLSAVLQENVLSWLGEDALVRGKRSAENNNYMTEFNFTLLSGEVETMETGKRLDFRLDINVPKTDGMDLTVEFFTKDIGNGNYTPVLALFNVEVESSPSGLSYSKTNAPAIEMLLSDEINTAYDRAIVTFGDVKNTNDGPVSIVMQFSVTQIRNPNTIFESKYLVTAGAEYDKETYVWVGQSEITVHNSSDDRQIEVDIIGSTEIPLDSAGVYIMVAHIAIRSDNLTVEIEGPEETETTVVSVGNLGVKDFDKNFDPVPQSIYFYNTTKEGSDDDVEYTSAQLNLGIMTNVGTYQAARDEGNVINITFAIYALNYEENIDKTVTIITNIYAGKDKLYTNTITITITKRIEADKMVTARTTEGELAKPTASIGDMVIYTLWSNLTNNGYADYVLEVEVPRDNKRLPRLEACSARLWHYKGSFDVPYLNSTFIDPEIKDEKFTFKFHRIHVTGQRNPSIYNDSMVYIHIVVKVSALPVNKEGSELKPTIKVGTQGVPDKEVRVKGVIIKKNTDVPVPTMSIVNAVQWPFLYIGGAVVLNVTMAVPLAQGYADVLLEASGENNPPLPAVHICRAELSDVGRNVPCLRMHQDEVNKDFTKYSKTDPKTRTKPDMSSVMLGDVGALPVKGRNHATVSFVVELPEKSAIKDDEVYPISTGLLISTNTIWAAEANYTMKKGPPPELEADKHPTAFAVYENEEGIVPGHLASVDVHVITKIQSIGAYTIEVEGSTKDLSLCGLKVKSFGRNLPCIDMDTEPFYQPHDNPLDGNKIAGLKFSALSNVGFRANETHDTLVAIALVRISPSCKKSETILKWRVVFGGGIVEDQVTITVNLVSGDSGMSMTVQEPKALHFKAAYPNKAVSLGSPVVVDLEVALEPGSLAPVTVYLRNDANRKKVVYDMCLGGIWFRGRNYPCFSPVQVESNFTSSDEDSGHKDGATYNLGLVCNTFVDNKEEENKLTVRMAMRPVDDGALKIRDQFSIEGHAIVGSHHKQISTLKYSIAREPDQVETETNGTLKLVNPSPIPIRIHQRLWVPFNITIPPDAVVRVEAEAKAPLKGDRAILTVHNMRLVSGGVNIPCPMLYPQPKVTFNPIVKTTQSDVIRAYIGYFTNLGLSHKMNMANDGDDDLTVEVEVEMSDHPETDNEKVFMLNFGAEVGRSILLIQQPMKVFRDGAERANLDVNIKVDSSKPYQSGDKIDVVVTVKHHNDSTAEPINATIRLYLPPYVEYDRVVSKNVSIVGNVSLEKDAGGLDIVFPQFLFSDSATMTINLLADPKNKRGFGHGEVNATTPYRVLCRQTYREEPSPNPESASTVVNCGPVSHIMYIVNSQECYRNLGLKDSGKIYKCQLSASSAAKKETGPYNIRLGGKKGWSPALRLGPHKPFFQMDFMRTTRVSKIEFYKVDGTRSITKYRLLYSHTGSDWLYANEVTELTYKKTMATDLLEKPIQTRFIRVNVEEAEKLNEDNSYIGMKMEVYGCHIAEKAPSVGCSKKDPTWYSDDKTKYGRHFSVDTGRDIVYFCDLEYDMENLMCFSSTDAGNSWRILPKSIGGVLGYDKKTGRTYAIDKRKRAYVASDDGIMWVAVDEMDVNTTMTKKSFYRSEPVPAFTSEDIAMLVTKTGRWEATFDGLMYEGKADPKARWSRCCKLSK